jgi:hypothetical protein
MTAAAPDTERRPPPRRTGGGWGLGGGALVAIVLGAVILVQARLDPAEPATTAPTVHAEQHGVEIAGIPHHPDAAIATLAARLTPPSGVTTIRSVGAPAAPAVTPRAEATPAP